MRSIAAVPAGEYSKYDLIGSTKRFGLGLVLGGGLEFATTGRWTPFLEIRYALGLTDLSDIAYNFFRARTLALSAGVKFGRPG